MRLVVALLCFVFCHSVSAQNLKKEINSILAGSPLQPFSGVVLMVKGKEVLYQKVQGSGKKNQPIKIDSRFVVGSISKQFTGALLLREIDAGRLDVNLPIRHYLPELPQKWADTVTAHHLITHMHGIRKLDQPTVFAVGSKYEYSQIGFKLLEMVMEKTSGKSFKELSTELFAECGLTHTFHPDEKRNIEIVTSFTWKGGTLEVEKSSLMHYPSAGSFISTAQDLVKWNKLFYSGKLFSPTSFKTLTTKQDGAVRQHPLFQDTYYGYGITVDNKDSIVQYGQTGFAPGFVSLNFYYPEKDLSLVILSNVVWDENDIQNAFTYHMSIWKKVRENIKSWK